MVFSQFTDVTEDETGLGVTYNKLYCILILTREEYLSIKD